MVREEGGWCGAARGLGRVVCCGEVSSLDHTDAFHRIGASCFLWAKERDLHGHTEQNSGTEVLCRRVARTGWQGL